MGPKSANPNLTFSCLNRGFAVSREHAIWFSWFMCFRTANSYDILACVDAV